MRCCFTAICVLSSVMYTTWGIWPLCGWLLVEWKRRENTDYCQRVQQAGVGFSVFSLLSAVVVLVCWLCLRGSCSTLLGTTEDGQWQSGNSGTVRTTTRKIRRLYAIPLLAHAGAFVGELLVTIDASSVLWTGEVGLFCKLESPPFYSAAEVYVFITFPMLFLQLLVCLYLCRFIWLIFRSPDEARRFVWQEIVPLTSVGAREEGQGYADEDGVRDVDVGLGLG